MASLSAVAEASPREPGPGEIVIHVCDAGHNIRRDFTCSQELLLEHMKYFECYLEGVSSNRDVDISVHCDVGVFEWLVEYMGDTRRAQSLEASTVVPILISADFLQMRRLVDECLHFLQRAINQVIRLPIDFSCLSSDLVRRLVRLLSHEEMELIRDKRDKLLGRLYAHKLAEMLGDCGDAVPQLCANCRGIFTEQQRDRVVCSKARISIGFNGHVIAQHVADETWDVSRHVRYCHEQLRLSWREIYWRMWGRLNTLWCGTCGCHFCAAELGQCLYHTAKPEWYEAPRAHAGVYPCCQQLALRFGTSVRRTGCCARDHTVELDAQSGQGAAPRADQDAVLETLRRHRDLVCMPLEGPEWPERGAQGREARDEWREESESEDVTKGDHMGVGPWQPEGQSRVFSYCFDALAEHREQPRRAKSSFSWRPESHCADLVGDAQGRWLVDDGWPGAHWPRYSPADEASLFGPHFPPAVPGHRKLEGKLDALREDDHRRMDDLGERLRRAQRVARPRGKARSSFLWLVEGAASPEPRKALARSRVPPRALRPERPRDRERAVPALGQAPESAPSGPLEAPVTALASLGTRRVPITHPASPARVRQPGEGGHRPLSAPLPFHRAAGMRKQSASRKHQQMLLQGVG